MNAAEFKQSMAALPEPPTDSAPPHWNHWRHDLWWRAQHDPREMWDWPCLRHTMLVEHFTAGDQMAYLREDWPRWQRAFSNHDVAIHARNLIHQAYHLKLWEDTTGRKVESLDSILEFGGGYGAMCQLARRMGFTGVYTIVDLPEFELLQKHWLASENVRVRHTDGPIACDLFIAIYSLSETEPVYRQRFLRYLKADSLLMLYSARFDQWDNEAWARQVASERTEMTWSFKQFPMREDWYMVGR